MKHGRVSIIVPMFNAARYIEATLASVLAQTYGDWELIVVDDGSTDASKAKVLEFISGHACDAKLLHHPHHQNRGTSESRNLGMSHATGEFLCFLDADDLWHPEFLSVLAGVLAKNSEVSMAYGPALLWHTDRDDSADAEQFLGVKTNSLVGPNDLFRMFLVGDADTPSPSGVMMRRSFLTEVGGWEESFPGMYDDQVVYSKLLLGGGAVYVTARCLYRYRQHAESVCKTATRERKEADSREKYLEWLRQYLDQHGKLSEDLEVILAEQMWNVRRHKEVERLTAAGWWQRKVGAIGSLVTLLGQQGSLMKAAKLCWRIVGQQILKPVSKFVASRH